ncbi:hypothetical protein IMZ48_20415 [Candidatus Bathyarchaeota archaeon]|nr:hypothetical protein [Candidatus Bathyarchaeota archaeon]
MYHVVQIKANSPSSSELNCLNGNRKFTTRLDPLAFAPSSSQLPGALTRRPSSSTITSPGTRHVPSPISRESAAGVRVNGGLRAMPQVRVAPLRADGRVLGLAKVNAIAPRSEQGALSSPFLCATRYSV